MSVATEKPAVLASESPIPESLVGVVQSFNYAPRGECNGVLLKLEGKLVQVNLRPCESTAVAKGIAIGDRISVSALHEETDADHPVYRARELFTALGQKITLADPSPGGRPQRSSRARGFRTEARIRFVIRSGRSRRDGVWWRRSAELTGNPAHAEG